MKDQIGLGHTILYDTLINDVATNDIAMIYHADMYLCPGALDAMKRKRNREEKLLVSNLTRIEPPYIPDGPRKVYWNWRCRTRRFLKKQCY